MVEDSGGEPLPDALIIAWPKGKHGKAVVQARSREDGRFVLPRMHPGTWTLLAEAAGLGTLEREQVVPHAGALVLTLEGRSRRLQGVVLADGRPRPDARVVLGGPALRWPREATADNAGVFTFTGLGLGKLSIRATHGPRVSPVISLTDEGERVDRSAPIRLVLSQGAQVEGRVTDDRGEPVAGTTVDVLTVPSDDLPASGVADATGHYRIGPVPSGRYQILARAEGHVALDAPEPRLSAGSHAKYDLRLARAAGVTGRVRDEQGMPLAGVAVTVVRLAGGRDELTVIPGALPTAAEAAELPAGSVALQGSSRVATTNLLGEYSLTGLAPGPARLEFVHPDKLPYRREPLLLGPGESRELDEAVLRPGVSLTGRVLDEDGQPVDGAQVEARPTQRSVRLPVHVSTDPHGEFALRVPAGDYALSFRANGYQTQSNPLVRAMSGVALAPLEVRLRHSPSPAAR